MTDEVQSTPEDINSEREARAEKLRKIADLGLDPWGRRYDDVEPAADVLKKPCVPFDEEPTERGRVAGRVVLRRGQGRVHFMQVRDKTGDIQVMVGKKQVGDAGWELAQLLDRGDLIGCEGRFGKTRTGEPTIQVESLTFLGKSLEPHPEKHAGMQDIEYRLRHRYLDLVYTPETLTRAQQRIKIIRTIRNYLDERGYSEVETPTLHAIAGGAAARPFETHHNALDIPLFVRIALELHLKRLLVGGMEKVYEIGRVFRNEGISHKHNPEFTMMELYQAYGDYHTMMDLTEGLVVACVDALGGGRERRYGEKAIDFTPPWQRAKYADLLKGHAGADMADEASVLKAAGDHKINTAGKDLDVVIHELFEEVVEDKLVGPVFVHDYPAALCPLTKRQADNPKVAERFELYIHGMELANAYTELNDPITQEATFRNQLKGLKDEDSMAKMDDDFIRALRHGMPPAGGLGVGIDRLVMLLTDTQSIRDVILFPLLRPEK